LESKAKEVDELERVIEQCKVIALADLHKVRAAQLQELRKKLKQDAHLRVIKNTLMKRAISSVKGKPGLEKLGDHLTGSTIYLFTNLNPFKLVLLLKKSKVKTTAKSGDLAAFDVIVPAGNTGQAPGPIISQLGAVGLKTRIESGSVWINKDTLVVKKGEVISQRLAAVLSKLGLKPVEAGLTLKAVYDDGMVIGMDMLQLDVETTRKDVEDASRLALHLSIVSAYTMPANIEFILQKAHNDSFSLSVSGGIFTEETISHIVKRAHSQMLSLKSRLDMVKQNAKKA
jgi:large subunit ribosomal protein L10